MVKIILSPEIMKNHLIIPFAPLYNKQADSDKINRFAEEMKNNPNREKYNLLNNNCKTFAKRAVSAGVK
jgi:hypothetical protein